jgi:hypothetical protein
LREKERKAKSMAEVQVNPELLERSVEFYDNPQHYLHVDINEYPVVIDCIDPRHKIVSQYFSKLVTIQTPGGKIGIGHDEAIARDASHNLGPMTAKDGAILNAKRGYGVAYPHDSVCKYGEGYVAVENEAINPSDYTRSMLNEWYGIHDFDPSLRTQQKLRDAQSRHLELSLANGGAQNPEDFIDPNWSNVEREHMHVVGPNLSRMYVVTHHTDLRVDRDARRKMGVQGYHDNIGALLNYYENLKVSGRQREMLGLIALSRSVATRTAVGSQVPDMNYREVHYAPTQEYDLEIREIEGPLK